MSRTQEIVIGVVSVVLACLLLIAGILVGAATIGWRSAVRSGNEAASIQNLKAIGWAETRYYATQGRKYGMLEELASEQLIDARFKADAPVVDGYVYQLTIVAGTSNARQMYFVTADPMDSSTGTSHFYRNSSSEEIRGNPDHRAGPNDPPLSK